MNDDITLADVMEAVDEYLTVCEDSSDIPRHYDDELARQKVRSQSRIKRRDMQNYDHDDVSMRSALNNQTKKGFKGAKKLNKLATKPDAHDYKVNMSISQNKGFKNGTPGPDRRSSKSWDKFAKVYKKYKKPDDYDYDYESVDDLRLKVYEAFEFGLIDADEKSVMLEYLNLENYE